MLSLEQLYGEANNLKGLLHPLTGRAYAYMTDDQAIALAAELTDIIITSGITNIVVSETGASPLAEICEKIALLRKRRLHFRRIKFPREPSRNLAPLLSSFLLPQERSAALAPHAVEQLNRSPAAARLQIPNQLSREELLHRLCLSMPENVSLAGLPNVLQLLQSIEAGEQTPFQRGSSIIFSGTEIAKLIGAPFVYLDEYIDSGTTLRNAIFFFKCFASRPKFRTAAYFTNLDESPWPAAMLYTRFVSRDRPDCYALGAYPYENRLDLIGHYYRIDCQTYRRIDLREIHADLDSAQDHDCAPLLSALNETIETNALLQRVQDRLDLPQIKSFLTVANVLHRSIYELEMRVGTKDHAEFLFQLFDMYGPAWSPMPTSFHFDFWKGFADFGEVFSAIPQCEALASLYKMYRPALLRRVSSICLQRRKAWVEKISKRVEEIYGSRTTISTASEGVVRNIH